MFVTGYTIQNVPIDNHGFATAVLLHEATCRNTQRFRTILHHRHTPPAAEVYTQVFTLFPSYGDKNLFKVKNNLNYI